MSKWEKAWKELRPEDVVVLPALFEEGNIGQTLEYVISRGVEPSQIVLVESNMTDKDDPTVRVAREVVHSLTGTRNAMRVVSQRDMLGRGSTVLNVLREQFGLPKNEFCVGKGAAMYAAVLDLVQRGVDFDTRIFFLDTDLTHLQSADPIGKLLLAWEGAPKARLVKLGWPENSGFSAGLNFLPEPYCQLAQVTWPLCGQQGIRLGDIANMPLPIGWCIEYGLMAGVLERYGITAFAEHPLTETLREANGYPQVKYVVMHTVIGLFARDMATSGGVQSYGESTEKLRVHNQMVNVRQRLIYVPQEPDLKQVTVDPLLPPATQMHRRLQRSIAA